MEDAAGIGRLDLLKQRWEAGHTSEGNAALRMACWYGRIEIVDYLLQQGVDVESRDPKDGDSALHITAFNGHAEIARLLLRHGADVRAVDNVYKTPPIVWALHAWLVENRNTGDYRATAVALLENGAKVRADWIDDDRLRQDPELWRLLTNSPLARP
jgi:ankyrin repeat protein